MILCLKLKIDWSKEPPAKFWFGACWMENVWRFQYIQASQKTILCNICKSSLSKVYWLHSNVWKNPPFWKWISILFVLSRTEAFFISNYLSSFTYKGHPTHDQLHLPFFLHLQRPPRTWPITAQCWYPDDVLHKTRRVASAAISPTISTEISAFLMLSEWTAYNCTREVCEIAPLIFPLKLLSAWLSST